MTLPKWEKWGGWSVPNMWGLGMHAAPAKLLETSWSQRWTQKWKPQPYSLSPDNWRILGISLGHQHLSPSGLRSSFPAIFQSKRSKEHSRCGALLQDRLAHLGNAGGRGKFHLRSAQALRFKQNKRNRGYNPCPVCSNCWWESFANAANDKITFPGPKAKKNHCALRITMVYSICVDIYIYICIYK